MLFPVFTGTQAVCPLTEPMDQILEASPLGGLRALLRLTH